jgi:hypothetical protein
MAVFQPPTKCLYDYNEADWHEVKEEDLHTTCTPTCTQLPDWCKVERHGYDNEQKRYFEIVYIDKKWIDIEYLDDGNGATCDYADIAKCSEARKRPFNSKEMKNLASAFAITFDGDISMITDYDWFAEKVRICGEWLCAEELMESTWRVYNKPCYKLEHLENGEWVE